MTNHDDRTVHATSKDKKTEVVRYDRAGRWYLERLDGRSRRQVSVREAAEVAARGTTRFGRPGGAAFDRLVRQRRAQLAASRRLPPF